MVVKNGMPSRHKLAEMNRPGFAGDSILCEDRVMNRRKRTKTKGGFPNDDSLLNLLFMGIQNASKKWTMPVRNWNLTIPQLSIFFKGLLDAALEL